MSDSLAKPTGLRTEYVEKVLGWQWVENCGGTAHWKDSKGSCHAVLPSWLWELRIDQIKALLKHEAFRNRKE